MEKIDNISFQAKYISSTKVKTYYDGIKTFLPKKVSFIEMDLDNKTDKAILHKLAECWLEASFMGHIADTKNIPANKVYALTLQKNNFEKLNPNLFLGFARINDYKNKEMELCYLQVNPLFMNVGKKGKKILIGVGKGILNSLKKIYNKIELNSTDEKDVEAFYENNGFICISYTTGRYVWNKAKSVPFFERMLLKIASLFSGTPYNEF